MAKGSETARDRVIRLWEPLLGSRYARLRAEALPPLLRGYLGAIFIILLIVVLVFLIRSPIMYLIVGCALVIVSAIWLTLGLFPLYHVAQHFAAELRENGIAMNHTPALNSVLVFNKWLANNNLSADEIVAICDKRLPRSPEG